MIQIVPAIDIIGGKCVRLSQGDYDRRKTYNSSPLDVALALQDAGCNRLHLVDLDGAISHHIVNYKVIELIASKTKFVIDFGGGIKSDEDLHIAFESGASMITGGSIAVRNPILFSDWVKRYTGDKIILGADTKNGKIAIDGWTKQSDDNVIPFINDYIKIGIKHVVCTDVAHDGMLAGPSSELYRQILNECEGVKLIASGGIRSIDDVIELNNLNATLIESCTAQISEAIIGKAILDGHITMHDLESYNQQNI